MNLRDQGHRFCLSPDKKEARWLHPNIKAHLYPDWVFLGRDSEGNSYYRCRRCGMEDDG